MNQSHRPHPTPRYGVPLDVSAETPPLRFRVHRLPCFWAETILLRLLNLGTMTSFRMFPPPDIVPEFPTGLTYGFTLINALCIPRYVSSDQRLDGRAMLGMILRPLTQRQAHL